jgi:hypothetical protein
MKSRHGKGTLAAAAALCAGLGLAATAQAEERSPRDYAKTLFARLAGVPLMQTDPRLAQMEQLIAAGDMQGAARVATSDPYFYNVTLWNWTAVMSNKDHSSLVDLNDFMTTFIGAVRDDLDARTLLNGSYYYRGDAALGLPEPVPTSNAHFEALGRSGADLKQSLVRVDTPLNGTPDAAGLLTTRTWGKEHFIAGTNRRVIEYSIQEFLCAPIASWKDVGLPEDRIRRDVDRAPAGDAQNFQNVCRSCHGGMDGFGGATARYDYVDDQLKYYGPDGIAPKMNKNGQTYPDGFVTYDDSWVNYITTGANASFGWRGPTRGYGMHEFGTMLGNSKAFSKCMTTKAFKEICKRAPTGEDEDQIGELAAGFESDGYKLKGLFEQVAVTEACLGTVARNH